MWETRRNSCTIRIRSPYSVATETPADPGGPGPYCRKVVVAFTNQETVQAMISTRTKAKARTKKERAKKVLILTLDLKPRKHSMKKDMVISGNQTIGLPAIGLTIPQLQLLGGLVRELILHGWHQSL